MTHHPLKINRPSLNPPWTEKQMKSATTRIHNRFQGLLLSVIESAKWANWHEVEHPLEAHHPEWPEPGKYVDLILSRREADVVAALEVKTRYIKPSDKSTHYDIMSQVLEGMGERLIELQKAAKAAEALWIVALGIYRNPPQSATVQHLIPFEIVMMWGRDVGFMTPMGRGMWHSINHLDRAMADFIDPLQFWSVVSLPRRVLKPRPQPVETQPIEPSVVSSTLFEGVAMPIDQGATLEEMVKAVPLPKHIRLTLLAVIDWPNEPTSMIHHLTPYAQPGASAGYMRDTIARLSRRGIIDGFKAHSSKQSLTVNRDKLINYLQQV